jgi:hypothetical protein
MKDNIEMYFEEVVLEYAVISVSLSPRHGAYSGCRWRNGLQYEELGIY